jgi:hypothetical protein
VASVNDNNCPEVPLKCSASAAQGFAHFSQSQAAFSLAAKSPLGSIAAVPIDDKLCQGKTLREI